MCLSISFASSFVLLVEPLENSPRCKRNPTFKDDSRDAGADLASQPEAHEDLVDVRPRIRTWLRRTPSSTKPRDSYNRRARAFVAKTASSAFSKPWARIHSRIRSIRTRP